MSTRAVVLMSGGLDSRLAVRILQEQGIEVHALNFKTVFTCCQDMSAQAARDLDIPLTVLGQQDDYLDLIRRPKYGYGKGANPCVDCRIYMFERAKTFMQHIGASLIASGEVVGQRPKSQKRKDLYLIAVKSGLREQLLRPLSAKLMPPTESELTGLVDRQRLFGFHGRSRKGLIELARGYGFSDAEIPSPSTGCALTEPLFSNKVFDLMRLDDESSRWDFELLKTGRHFRADAATKVVVGRRESENIHLQYLIDLPDASTCSALVPNNFAGPTAIVVGPQTSAAIDFAGGLLCRYAHNPGDSPQVLLHQNGTQTLIPIGPNAEAMAITTL